MLQQVVREDRQVQREDEAGEDGAKGDDCHQRQADDRDRIASKTHPGVFAEADLLGIFPIELLEALDGYGGHQLSLTRGSMTV